ncbi:hypothetical protein CGLY_16020 [Corynebacterium glyciniphilum AJ 3170]|uniref:DUF559 domain-containing protein n=1 Tax=Corynebacterium glyciniphilum AJ 3170 TaxID=1404245 RepID=X5EE12_9CORY|nr:hypothetical protein [Corynebacterium glyciniphilum]AHW65640.1 hypothetical protein CGLY_16020 [Corynebacterium glyciniphilum AJ 3170]
MGAFGGYHWNQAARNGRIRPGRGPYFARRVFPTRIPLLRTTALARGTPRSVVDSWEKLVRRVVLPPLPENVDTSSRLGPCGHGDDPSPYLWDIVTRTRALWLLTSDAVVGGWSAAGLHGLPHWADNEKVVLLSTRTRRNNTGSNGAVFRALKDGTPTVTPDPEFAEMRAVTAATAAAQCLAMILTGKKTWYVHDVPGMEDRHVRAIQFIDAMYQCTHLTAELILDGARGIVCRRTLKRLLTLTDYGAQSPMETVLRLVVRDELPDGYRWTSQVRIDLGNGRSTVPDLACPELGIALYYDGRHHDEPGQTDTDFMLFQKLKNAGWEALRVNRKLLADLEELMEQLQGAIFRAQEVRAHAARASRPADVG